MNRNIARIQQNGTTHTWTRCGATASAKYYLGAGKYMPGHLVDALTVLGLESLRLNYCHFLRGQEMAKQAERQTIRRPRGPVVGFTGKTARKRAAKAATRNAAVDAEAQAEAQKQAKKDAIEAKKVLDANVFELAIKLDCDHEEDRETLVELLAA